MANNRMYIRCKTCGAIVFIAKCYLDGYYTNSNDLNDRLDDFFKEHAYCSNDLNDDKIKYIDTPFIKDDNYYNRFELCYEHEYKEDNNE